MSLPPTVDPSHHKLPSKLPRRQEDVKDGRRRRCVTVVFHLARLSPLTALAFVALALALSGADRSPVAAAADNPIVLENQQPGTTDWQIGPVATDTGGQIKGYASATSVNAGESVTFYVSVAPEQSYTIDVYRIGFYQGLGGRRMAHVGSLNGVRQPACPSDPVTGLTACAWTPSYTLATQTSWTSGIYLALLTNVAGYQSYIVFVVRGDSRPATLLYQQPVTTYQAYNNYPNDRTTGKSLYEYNSFGATTVTGTARAAKVSFDRPYSGDGSSQFLWWEINFVRWMERSGYDVTYSTDIDTDANGGRLTNYRGMLSVGHDEYWTKRMYDAAFQARDSGVNLGFFGADPIGWQARLEPSASGSPSRVLVCYKDAAIDPISDPALKTVEWHDEYLNRPEQTLVGVQYAAQIQDGGYVPYVVANAANWAYAGTGLKDGDRIDGIVGYEADHYASRYPLPDAVPGTYTLLSQSPFTTASGASNLANSVTYQAPSGAWVFATGSDGWSWALDDHGGRGLLDARIQRTTANVLDRFSSGPQSDFALSVSPTTQVVVQGSATSYAITVNPHNGFGAQVDLGVSGLPSGASAVFTPSQTDTTSALSVNTTAATPVGSYPLTINGASGSLMRSATVTLVVDPAPRPDFSVTASPATARVKQGGTVRYTVDIGAADGFNDAVALSVTAPPSGVTATFSPNPTASRSTLTVAVDESAKRGTSTLTVTGVSAGLSHSTVVALRVTK